MRPGIQRIVTSIFPFSRRRASRYVLVIHGGAGTMSREGSTPEKRATYRAALSQALKAGYGVLKQGGEAMDAVVAAVSVMEGGIYTKSRRIGWLTTGFQI